MPHLQCNIEVGPSVVYIVTCNLLLCTLPSTMYAKSLHHVCKQITMNSYRHCSLLCMCSSSLVASCMCCHNFETVSIPIKCSAKQNESMKLMMVGFQKMGKTTILSRLCECHERVTPSTTFLQRVTGEEPTPPARSKGKRTGQYAQIYEDSPPPTHTHTT